MARWNSSDLPSAAAQAPRKAAAATPVPAGAVGAGSGQEIAKRGNLPLPTVGAYPGPCSWVLAGGRATVSLARPYDPTRHRLVLACAPDEALVAAVLVAVAAHFETIQLKP